MNAESKSLAITIIGTGLTTAIALAGLTSLPLSWLRDDMRGMEDRLQGGTRTLSQQVVTIQGNTEDITSRIAHLELLYEGSQIDRIVDTPDLPNPDGPTPTARPRGERL